MASERKIERTSVLYFIGRFICFWFFRLIWRLQVHGLEHIPRSGPVIIASNHCSYADPPLVGLRVPRVAHFLAKKELFAFPPFGWLLLKLNSHPLNRAHGIGALRAAEEILEQHGVVVLFPEGKRNKTDQLLRPKSGVGMLALRSGAPVVPAFIHNSNRLFKGKKVEVFYSAPVDPRQFQTYETLAHHVMEKIQKMKDQVDRKI